MLAPILCLLTLPAADPFRNAELQVESSHEKLSRLSVAGDGRALFTVGEGDAQAKVWDLSSGRLRRTFGGVTNHAVSGSGRSLVVEAGGQVTLYDVRTGQRRLAFSVAGVVHALACTDEGRVAVSTYGRTRGVEVWDAGRRAPIARFEDVGAARSLVFSPAGDAVAAGGWRGQDRGLFLLPIDGGPVRFAEAFEQDETMMEPELPFLLRYGPDGRLVGLLARRFRLRLDPTTWTVELREIPGLAARLRTRERRQRGPSGFELSEDGRWLAVGFRGDGPEDVEVYDTETGAVRAALDDRGAVERRPVAFLPGSRVLAAGAAGGAVRLWDLESRRVALELGGRGRRPLALAFSPDGTLLASGHPDGLRLWSLTTGELLRHVPATWVRAIAWSSNGRTLAFAPGIEDVALTSDVPGPVTLLDPRSGAVLRRLTARIKKGYEAFGALGLAFRPDGKLLAVGYGDGVLRTFDPDTGKPGRELPLQGGSGVAVFDPTGARVLAGPRTHDRGSVLWSAGLDRPVDLPGEPLRSAAFSPDGRHLYALLSGYHGALVDFELGPGAPTSPRTMVLGVAGVHAAAFSADGLRAAVLSERADLFDLTTGKRLHTFGQSHTGWIRVVAVDPSGRWIATGADDQTLRLWRLETGEEVLRLVPIGQEDAIAATPDGYYRATKGALGAVGLRVGDELRSFEQFDLRLNRPDLVSGRLGRARAAVIDGQRRAYERRLARMGLTEAELSAGIDVPLLELVEPLPPPATAERKVALLAKVGGASLERAALFVSADDVPLDGPRGRPLAAVPRAGDGALRIEVELGAGANVLQVWVRDGRGLESAREVVRVAYTGPSSPPALYVAAIGVSDYAGEDDDLTYAAKDARDVLARFGAGRRWSRVVTRELTDAAATAEAVRGLAGFFGEAGVDDQVVLFAAGHGFLDERRDYFFGTVDADPGTRKGGLPYEELEGVLDGLRARNKLLLVDACNSGELDEEAAPAERASVADGVRTRGVARASAVRSGATFALLRDLFADLRRGSGAAVISASAGDQLAMESGTWKNGLFTYVLLDGLSRRTADRDRDGEVRVSELRDHVTEGVERLSGGLQTPTARRESVLEDFVVY